jgi:hypothetical protein
MYSIFSEKKIFWGKIFQNWIDANKWNFKKNRIYLNFAELVWNNGNWKHFFVLFRKNSRLLSFGFAWLFQRKIISWWAMNGLPHPPGKGGGTVLGQETVGAWYHLSRHSQCRRGVQTSLIRRNLRNIERSRSRLPREGFASTLGTTQSTWNRSSRGK